MNFDQFWFQNHPMKEHLHVIEIVIFHLQISHQIFSRRQSAVHCSNLCSRGLSIKDESGWIFQMQSSGITGKGRARSNISRILSA